MFRAVTARCGGLMQALVRSHQPKTLGVTVVKRNAHGEVMDPDEFDARYEKFFSKPDIDGWEVRKGMNDLQGMDLVPEPKIMIAALKACRRVNDHSLAIRFLEGVKDKCGAHANEIWPYLMQECGPTMKELGISTLEEMGYDKPELALQDVYDIHG